VADASAENGFKSLSNLGYCDFSWVYGTRMNENTGHIGVLMSYDDCWKQSKGQRMSACESVMWSTHEVTPVSTIRFATISMPWRYASSSSCIEKSKPYAPLICMSMKPGLVRSLEVGPIQSGFCEPEDVSAEVDRSLGPLLVDEESILQRIVL